jgi:hypothetical protein
MVASAAVGVRLTLPAAGSSVSTFTTTGVPLKSLFDGLQESHFMIGNALVLQTIVAGTIPVRLFQNFSIFLALLQSYKLSL